MELSINEYVDFIRLTNSLWGWLAFSTLLLLIAQFRPLMAISLMCFYPTLLWSAPWKPIVTLYPCYPLILFLVIKYVRKILSAILGFRYRIVIILSAFIIIWSFFSPLLYPVPYGLPITFTQNPIYQRGILSIVILFLMPAALGSRDDIRKFLYATFQLFIVVHLLVVLAAVFFLALGNSIYDLHLMRILDTPPIYWESGLFLIFLAYAFVGRKVRSSMIMWYGMLAFAGLVLGNSRTRFLATLLCLLYFMYPNVSKRLIAWMLTLALLSSTSLLLLPGSVEDYFSKLIQQRIEQSSGKTFAEMSTGRTKAYEYAYKKWKENPFVGVGSCYILPRSIYTGVSTPIPRVHNYYLEVLAGQGVVGFGLLIIVLFICFVSMLKIGMMKSTMVLDGRLIVALFLFGVINWMFKESWGITYSAITMLSLYRQTKESESPS
ncbi:MAG: O-antigen ligase family protein [Thermodesulfobacteriota bacterium]